MQTPATTPPATPTAIGVRNLSASDLSALLARSVACRAAREWATGKDLAAALDTCQRGDWMLWLLGNMIDEPGWLTRKQVCAILCDVVQPAMRYLPADELRPQACLDTVRRWIAGTATVEDLKEARKAALAAATAAADAYAAYCPAAYAAYTAAADAYAAYCPAAYAAYTAAAAYVAADAAAAYDAGAAAYASRKQSLAKSADICRSHVSVVRDEQEVGA